MEMNGQKYASFYLSIDSLQKQLVTVNGMTVDKDSAKFTGIQRRWTVLAILFKQDPTMGCL